MNICTSCEFKRIKLHDDALIECKHPRLASGEGDVLGEMQNFIRSGVSSEFFTVSYTHLTLPTILLV